MTSYKLKYFNARGFGEVPRLLFVLADQKFEDVRVTQEAWPEEKPNTPFGQMPILEIDGKPYCQSGAIARYLATKFGYYGSNDIEALEVDQMLGIMQDVINVMLNMFYEKNEERKAAMATEAREEKLPQYMKMFEKILKDNGGTGYFVGNKMSLADLMMFDMGEKFQSFVNFDDYPLTKKSREMVGANEKIAAWVAKRPVTET